MTANKKIVPSELDKLSPLEITTKFGFEGRNIDINNDYWRKRLFKLLNTESDQAIDRALEDYSQFGDPSLYDGFQNIASLFGYVTEGELEGFDNPEELLLPLLKRGDINGYSILIKTITDIPQELVDNLLYYLARLEAWDELLSLLKKSKDYLADEVSFRFLPIVLAKAPEDIKKQIVKKLKDYATEAGIPAEIDSTIREYQVIASIMNNDVSNANDTFETGDILLPPFKALETAVATGKSKTVEALSKVIDFDDIFDFDESVIKGAIISGKLTQADLDLMDLESLKDNEIQSFFRTLINYPNARIYRLLIKNNFVPTQSTLKILLEEVPAWDPLYIEIVNSLETAPQFEDINKAHLIDKQAHLIIAKRFPEYIKTISPNSLKMGGNSLNDRNNKELFEALQVLVHNIDKVKPQ